MPPKIIFDSWHQSLLVRYNFTCEAKIVVQVFNASHSKPSLLPLP